MILLQARLSKVIEQVLFNRISMKQSTTISLKRTDDIRMSDFIIQINSKTFPGMVTLAAKP